MKLDKRELERRLARPDPAVRAWLFYGQDDSTSLALADRIGTPDAERIDLDGSTLRGDPARLADEAASSSLFGGARWIRVRASGDEVLAAVEALIEAANVANPVAIVAGDLKGASRLLKLATASPSIMAVQSYMPDARQAGPLVQGLASEVGLRVRPDLAQRLFDAGGGDRAVIARELDKLALYLDADPERPRDLDPDALDAVGAGEAESSADALVLAVLAGRTGDVVAELRALGRAGGDGVPLVRAALRKLLTLAPLRTEADGKGVTAAVESAGRAVFWKDKPLIQAALSRWSSADLAMLVDRVTAAQAALLSPGTAGAVAVDQELVTIARAAAGRR